MGRGLGEGSDSEVSSVGTSDLSSDYDPADDSDLPTFRKQHGPLLHVAGNSTYTIFCSLWTDNTLDLFVEETNRYYRERIAKLGGAAS